MMKMVSHVRYTTLCAILVSCLLVISPWILIGLVKMPRHFSMIQHPLTDSLRVLLELAALEPTITISPQLIPTTRVRPEPFVRFPIVTSADLIEDDRQFFVKLVKTHEWKQVVLCRLFEGLSSTRLNEWIRNVENGLPCKYERGRPVKLNEARRSILYDRLNGYGRRAAGTTDQARKMLNDLVKEQYRDRHPFASESEIHAKSSISNKSEERIYKDVGFKDREAKRVQEARRVACLSRRHTFSYATALMALSGQSPSFLKVNADATTFTIKFNSLNGHRVMVPTSLPDELHGSNLRPEVTGPSEIDMIVKHMQISSANGETGGACLIFQDSNIPEGEFHYYEMNSFTCPTSISTSCLYFCSRRAGNKAMWQHWYVNRAIKFCQDLRAKHSLTGEYDGLPTLITEDGEAIIMNEAFHESVMLAFDQGDVVLARVPASTTSIHQACDRCIFFKSLKSGIDSELLMRQYCAKINRNDMLEAELLSSINYPGATLGFKRKVVRACLFIEYIFGETLKKVDVMDSFVVCGHHMSPTEDCADTVDFRKVMRQCHQVIDEEAMLNLEHHLPYFINQMKVEGRIKWDDMTERNISDEPESMNREELVLTRRACEIISHPNSRLRKQQWDYQHNPDVIKAQNLIARDMEEQAKEAAKLKEKQDKAAAKIALKAAEALYTPEQRAAAKLAKKQLQANNRQVAAARKRQREEAEQLKVNAKRQAVEAAKALLEARGVPVAVQAPRVDG